MKKLTERSTKKEILAVLKTTQQELRDAKKAVGVDQQVKAAEVKTLAIVEKAKNLSVEEIVKNYRLDINSALSTFESQILDKKTILDDINFAIEAQRTKLDEMYQIEIEADTLETILKSQVIEKEFKVAELIRIEQEMVEERQARITELDLRISDLKVERDRFDRSFQLHKDSERETWEYDFSKIQREAQDEINQNRLIAERDAERVIALQSELEQLRANIDIQIGDAVKQALDSEKRSRHFEVSTLKKDTEMQMTVANNTNAQLQSLITGLEAQIIDLKTSLAQAQQQVVDVSRQAISGASSVQPVINVGEVTEGKRGK